MRIILQRWKLFALLAVIVSALAPGSGTYAANPYIGPSPAVSYMVEEAWYDTEVTLLEAMSASSSDNEVPVSNATLLNPGWTIQLTSDSGPAEQMTITAVLSECDNDIDDDSDSLVNDGCPTIDDGVPHPETGTQCENAIDDDGDGKVNDGCPTVNDGVLPPETGSQCENNIDDDADSWRNDGCPALDVGGPQPETGDQCLNSYDDDDDSAANDGCPVTGFPEHTAYDECANDVDDDSDGYVNDGCAAEFVFADCDSNLDYDCADAGEPELCANDVDDDSDGYVNDGCSTVDDAEGNNDECAVGNDVDDDGDGYVNDGCPIFAGDAETGTQCDNATDDDSDGYVNDGCPIVGYDEQYSQCGDDVDDDVDGYFNDGCLAVDDPETACDDAVDDDEDGYVNDGCPAMDIGGPQPETGDQCANGTDDDDDGNVNDGCPAAADPEEGSECGNTTDDDSDGYVNDGCPARDIESEPGKECYNFSDDDSDGYINDGCPMVEPVSETGTQCANDIDDDGDGWKNDGCPVIGSYSEVAYYCVGSVDDDSDGYVNDGCPEYHLIAETGDQCTNSTDDDGDGYVNDGCPKSGTKETTTPTIMRVERSANGVLGAHSAGVPIQDHLFKTEIWVRDVPESDPYGVGSFYLKISFNPSELEYVKMSLDAGVDSWLASTGRDPYCFGPTYTDYGDSATVEGSCATLGNPMDPPWPKGPTGSGRIATLWLKVVDEDQLISRRYNLIGSRVEDVSSALITSLTQSGSVRTITCPDSNLDERINELDAAIVYLNLNDSGQDSGVTLADDIDDEQTTIPISEQGPLAVDNIVAIDNEHMLIIAINTDPLTLTVQRDLYPGIHGRAAPHASGTGIFIATGSGGDDEYAFTGPRDTNDDFVLNALDAVPVYSILNTWCPWHTP